MIKNITKTVFVLILVGCGPNSGIGNSASNEEREVNETQFLVNSLRFAKHKESGLCFAHGWQGGPHGGPTLTEVPCEKVEKLIK